MGSQHVHELKKLVSLGIQAADAYGRSDLSQRLRALTTVIDPSSLTVVVLGQFKQGKSSLVNALIGGANPCAVDDDIATAVPTFVSYGSVAAARILCEDPDNEQGVRRDISWDQLEEYVTEKPSANDDISLKAVEVELPRKLLEKGITLVDTPGVGGLGSPHATACLGTVSMADVAIFVSDASQEFTQPELEYLQQAQELCSAILCVSSKIDLYPAWREVVERNKKHLERVGVEAQIFPLSAFLREEAVKRNDQALNEESGCAELVRVLTGDYLLSGEKRFCQNISSNLLSACDQIASQLEAELSAVEGVEQREELLQGLEEAKSRSEKLKSMTSRWNVTLNDGTNDLTSDIEYDFRNRMRRVVAESDTSIESFDPVKSWDEFEPWLVNRVSQEVVANYQFLTHRSRELSEDVANHFAIDGGSLLHQVTVSGADTPLSKVIADLALDTKEASKAAKGLTILKGSYSGMLMCTVLGSMVSVTPLAPIAVGLGLLMGRKSLKDEKDRALKQRRGEAKNAMRRYCDEVSFQVNKDSRDTLRKVQRQLRDHYSERAEELHRSTGEALKAAAEAVKISESERAGRSKDLQAELRRVASLVQEIRKVSEEAGVLGRV